MKLQNYLLFMPTMVHRDPNTVSQAAGETARLSRRFMGDDTVVFACDLPGHFEAGMKHVLPVAAAPANQRIVCRRRAA